MREDLVSLGERIAEQVAHLDAAMHRLLVDLRVFDQEGGWHHQGAKSCAHWLSWRVGWTLATARDRVRVANRLAELPQIDRALQDGKLSYSKVRAMTRVATVANEETLLVQAQHSTAHQLETICRKYAMVVRHDKDASPKDDRERRRVTRRDLDDGMVRIEAVLHPEEAAIVWAALDGMAKQACRTRKASSEARTESDASVGTTRGSEAGAAASAKASTKATADSVLGRAVSAETLEEPGGQASAVTPHAPGGDANRSAAQRDLKVPVPGGTCGADVSAGASFQESRVPTAAEAELLEVHWARLLDRLGVLPEQGTGAGSARMDPDADHVSAETAGGSGAGCPAAVAEAPSAPTPSAAARHREPAFDRAAAQKRQHAFDRADALVAMAQQTIRGSSPHRSPIEVVLTMPAEALRVSDDEHDPMDVAVAADGTCLSTDAARRLACDAGVVELVEDHRGMPLSIGRKTRTIPGSMKRALLKRDRQTCRFPGCTNRLFLEGHHIEHWANGGETKLRNLVASCALHHRYVHEHGYTVALDADGEPRFHDPAGRLVEPNPAPARLAALGWPSIRARNAQLGITAETNVPGWHGDPVAYVDAIDDLVIADGG